MRFFFKKQKAIIQKIKDYIAKVDVCADRFWKCSSELINRVNSNSYKQMVESVHEAESQADDLKREIEYDLYKKALIPESRGDVLGVLETLDKIPNMLESVCFQLYLQKVIIPIDLRNIFLDLIKANIEAYHILKKAVMGLFYSNTIMDEIKQIDNMESKSDKIERNLIEMIFNSDMDNAHKILIKDIVINIGNISDRAQVVADRLALAVIKRRI